MEDPKFSLFKDSFSHIHYIQEGMGRINTVIDINPSSEGVFEDCFNALREALYFDIAVRQPFFGIVNEVVRPDIIFNRLLNTNLGIEQHISYEEAFQILTSLRWREYIIRAASDDTRVFNSLLTAVNENDFEKFEAVANGISSEWFNALWWLRFIFYGDGLQTDRGRLTSLWKSSLGFNQYFSVKTDEEASDFIASEQSKWAGIKNSEPKNVPEKSRRYRIRRMEPAMDVELSEQIFLCGNYYSFQERKFGAIPDIRRIMADASACAESIFKYCFNQNHEANVKAHLSETAQSIDINDLNNSSFISGEERDIFDDWYESLKYSNPNDISPLETFASACSYCMALIFHVIRKDIDQDAASVLNSIISSCRYTAPALKAINKEEKVQAKIKETSRNETNPVIEANLEAFLQEHFSMTKNGREFINKMLPNLCSMLERSTTPIRFRVFTRLFFPQLNGETQQKHKTDANRTNEILWRTPVPSKFEEAFERFLPIFEKCPQYKSLGATDSMDKYNQQMAEFRKVREDPLYGWINEWIETIWSDSAKKKINTKQEKHFDADLNK